MEPSYYIRAGTREYIRNKFTAEDSNIYLKKKKTSMDRRATLRRISDQLVAEHIAIRYSV